ncbi:fcd1ed96-f99e-4d28-9e70-49d2afc1fed5 [Chaetomidium leptoderma]|uniref:Fcd1ed96-f99e-4d28-9e70-49d2afc1fed5 n=1 Tax=Chaetomidium leptoderma TaxID=669021 RepID=A0AAN6VDS1_9PEZI|nr:fcd1ed96-f99e-4d28-9e70-49d2afc1fed5 [Chaetomidium leptoderma]
MAVSAVALFILPIFCLIHHAAGSKDGIVGFGISLYTDLCCQACHDSLSALYLTCTTFDHHGMEGMEGMGDMMMMGMTSEECYATNKAWLQTMAYCIQQNCNADGYPAEKQAECFSVQAVGGASMPTFHDSLPPKPPTVELAGNATWLNVTSLVNGDVYYATHGTLGEFAREEYLHTKYSVILYLVIIGICVVCGLLTQATSLLPKLQKQLQASALWSRLRYLIFLPALLGSRRLEPLPGLVGYVPGRALSIFIGVYVVLNVVFSAVSFGSFQPNIWFLSAEFELCEYVGNRTGTLSLVNMSIAILFAGRNNLLIALTGWSQTTFLTLHRWTARLATVQAVVHSIVYTLAYFEPGYEGAAAYAAKAAEPFYWWGIIATIALCLAAGFAFLPFRIRFYELFLVLHIVLVVLSLVGCWYHLVPHFGFDYGYQVWLYLCFAFWAADRLARLARVAYYNPLGGSKALVEAIPGCDIMQVTVFPRATWGFGPAQHSFLYLGGLGKFWESHPFSVAAWNTGSRQPTSAAPVSAPPSDGEEKGVNVSMRAQPEDEIHDGPPSIRFLVRAHSGMTSRLRRRLQAASAVELSVYTEGPYAGHRATIHPLFAADTILCIAGGIGITHILGFLQEFYAGAKRQQQQNGRGVVRAKRLILAWSARERSLIEHVKRNFLVDAEGVEYSFWCTGSRLELGSHGVEEASRTKTPDSSRMASTGVAAAVVTDGRMDIASVLRASVEAGRQTTVLACAPGGMADEVTKGVVGCVRDGFRVELVEETFAW